MPQGTVKYFDPETSSAVVMLDDRQELAVDAQTFLTSGLLELRLGQRVRVDVEGDGDDRKLTAINIVSI
jgi:2-phospho-L-lactate/phosphoenolpyruvate guanylyltransferase